MDAYLTAEARRILAAFGALSPKPRLSGFLLGHKRGHRFIVENIFPLPKGFQPTLEHYVGLNKLLDGKIIGFFSFPPDAVPKSSLWQPFACGKLVLGVRVAKKRSLHYESSIIDYDGRFRTKPIGLRT